MKIKTFLDGEVANYAVYKTIQQIPGFIDNLSQTQRKILYSLQSYPNKKIKTAETYTIIYNDTNYRHGDLSAYTTTENLAADYNNNISLLQPEATFGYRTVKKASSPRYTSIIFGKTAQTVFNKNDIPLYEKQVSQEHKLEPHFVLPIVPLALINGASGIAMGFSCVVNPRHPITIIDIIINVLTGKLKNIPKSIPLAYPFFKGSITAGETDNQFKITGVFEKKPRNTIIISELPISKNRERYISFLNKLMDDKKIKSFKEECKKNSFYFKISVEPDVYKLSDEKLIALFGLQETTSDSITMLDRENGEYTIRQFSSVSLFLKEWIIKRFSYYQKRKEYELTGLITLKNLYLEKIRFIELVNDNKIIINKKTKDDIEKQLVSNNFELIDGSYNYLLNMPIYNLSDSQIKLLYEKIAGIDKDIQINENTQVNEIWVKELRALKKLIQPELKMKGLI